MEEQRQGSWDKMYETGKGHWEDAFNSKAFREVVRKRFNFVVPGIVVFSALFFILFAIQQFCVGFASTMVFSNINVNFLYTMLLFPGLWLAGLVFLRYVRKHVYPLEKEVTSTFSKK